MLLARTGFGGSANLNRVVENAALFVLNLSRLTGIPIVAVITFTLLDHHHSSYAINFRLLCVQ